MFYTENYDELLEKVDAVYIVSKPEKHYIDTKKALLAGKHVLCESPIALKETDCEELYSIAVNLIFSQTRAYLAANTCDFCFLLQYLFDMPMRVDVVTDDDDQRIDTILNVDNQRQSLKELAEKYTSIRRKDYLEWRILNE